MLDMKAGIHHHHLIFDQEEDKQRSALKCECAITIIYEKNLSKTAQCI